MKSFIIIFVILLLAAFLFFSVFGLKDCGGFAGLACPNGFSCKVTGAYPDALGRCVFNPLIK